MTSSCYFKLIFKYYFIFSFLLYINDFHSSLFVLPLSVFFELKFIGDNYEKDCSYFLFYNYLAGWEMTRKCKMVVSWLAGIGVGWEGKMRR